MWTKILFAFYTLGIHAGNFYIFLARFFLPKIGLLYHGRKKTLNSLAAGATIKNPIWIHCASLGEFEQGRPIIEWYKSKFPNQAILLSFFSPSGYEIRKNYTMADEIIYLPSDLPKNADLLIEHYRPSILILVKYEFWWNTIKTVQNNSIPICLISGIFRENDYFFRRFFKPFKELLSKFSYTFTQDTISSSILTAHDIKNNICVGDTRIDRVLDNANNISLPEKISKFSNNTTTIIYGSIWMSDIEVVKNCIAAFPAFKHIIAPHDVNLKNVKAIISSISEPSVLYSGTTTDAKVLIIDNIGMLSKLYSIADYVYIGGGFQKGIHNILEPAVFYLPVFFGPKHQKFNEAVRLNSKGGAFAIDTVSQIVRHVQDFEKSSTLKEGVRNSLIQYFEENRGATEKIVRHLHQLIN